jgi:hypothetical protein
MAYESFNDDEEEFDDTTPERDLSAMTDEDLILGTMFGDDEMLREYLIRKLGTDAVISDEEFADLQVKRLNEPGDQEIEK